VASPSEEWMTTCSHPLEVAAVEDAELEAEWEEWEEWAVSQAAFNSCPADSLAEGLVAVEEVEEGIHLHNSSDVNSTRSFRGKIAPYIILVNYIYS
jgi:hypothetical protein